MMERHDEPLLSARKFCLRLLKSLKSVLLLVAISLTVGTCGYKFLEGISWVDAFYNASMILSGMGPAIELHDTGAKIFASLYAIYSGLFLIAATGILLIPIFHRVLHQFHKKKNADG